MIRCVCWPPRCSLALPAGRPVAAQLPRHRPARRTRRAAAARGAAQRPPGAPGARCAHPRATTTCCCSPARWSTSKLLVHYTLDTGGQLHDVWVLTPGEAARALADDARASPRLGLRPRRADLEPAMSEPALTKKVFIRTFGCQMNEYDSDKMADVLRAAEGYEPTTDVERGRPHPLQHLLGAREGAGEGLQRPRAASST